MKGVQSQTQGDQVRVTGKKRDDLQAVDRCLEGAGTSKSPSSSQLPRMRPQPRSSEWTFELRTA